MNLILREINTFHFFSRKDEWWLDYCAAFVDDERFDYEELKKLCTRKNNRYSRIQICTDEDRIIAGQISIILPSINCDFGLYIWVNDAYRKKGIGKLLHESSRQFDFEEQLFFLAELSPCIDDRWVEILKLKILPVRYAQPVCKNNLKPKLLRLGVSLEHADSFFQNITQTNKIIDVIYKQIYGLNEEQRKIMFSYLDAKGSD